MGYSVRSSNFRYSQYVKFNANKYQPQWPNDISSIDGEGKSELYDLALDPFQTNNWISRNGNDFAGVDSLEHSLFSHLQEKFPKV